MEENKNEEQIVNTEELKKETVDTVNQVKDTIKNVNIKNDAKEATGFVGAMFKDPLGEIKKIAEDNSNKFFKIALIFVAIWVIAEFLDATLAVVFSSYWTGKLAFTRLLGIIKTTVAPIIVVLALSLIVYFMNRGNKKTLLTTISSVAIAKIPTVLASVVGLLTLISSNISPIVNRIANLCTVVSVILSYFAIKALCGEEQNSKFIKKFVIIYAIYFVVSLVFYYLGIYIY